MQWRLRDEGKYLIHGHLHSAEKFNGREIHVGVDAWDFTPVPLETIADYIKEREALKDSVTKFKG
jgi:calcineurin-like phosphoesterase family protein